MLVGLEERRDVKILLRPGPASPSECEKVLDSGLQTVGFREGKTCVLASFLVGRPRQFLDVYAEGGERGAKLMRGVRRESAFGLEQVLQPTGGGVQSGSDCVG